MNTGQAADAEQAARAQATTHREPTEIAMGGIADFIKRAEAGWRRKKLAVQESDCPNCTVDAPAARACAFRGQDFCSHAPELRRRGRVVTLTANMSKGKVPPPYWKPISTGNFRESSATAAARRIIAEEGKLAILAGIPGNGKTFGLGLAIAEKGGLFCLASDLDPFGKETNDLVDACMEAPTLCLDDAAAGRSASDVARARIELILCARWDAGKSSMVSSNQARSTFWPLYGGALGRVADRLNQDPIGWVNCLEDSFRAHPPSANERGEK